MKTLKKISMILGMAFFTAFCGADMGCTQDQEDPFEVTLSVLPTEDYAEITVTATNTGDKPIVLKFNTAQQVDFYAKDGDRIIWQWSADKVFANAQSTLTLQQDDSITKTVKWNYTRNDGGRVKGGRYLVMGAITAQPQNQYSDPQEVGVPAVFQDEPLRQDTGSGGGIVEVDADGTSAN